MSSPSSVSINDDLAASESGVSLRASDDEGTAGIKDVTSIDEPFFRDGFLDDFVDEVLSDFLVGDIRVVLGGDEDGVDASRNTFNANVFVLDSDLDFSVGSDPR